MGAPTAILPRPVRVDAPYKPPKPRRTLRLSNLKTDPDSGFSLLLLLVVSVVLEVFLLLLSLVLQEV